MAYEDNNRSTDFCIELVGHTPTEIQQVYADHDALTAKLAAVPRTERCCKCGGLVSEWVEAEHRNGRICKPCEHVLSLTAKLATAQQDTERLWKYCKIVYWPVRDGYPLEHNPNANKDMQALIEEALAARKEQP